MSRLHLIQIFGVVLVVAVLTASAQEMVDQKSTLTTGGGRGQASSAVSTDLDRAPSNTVDLSNSSSNTVSVDDLPSNAQNIDDIPVNRINLDDAPSNTVNLDSL